MPQHNHVPQILIGWARSPFRLLLSITCPETWILSQACIAPCQRAQVMNGSRTCVDKCFEDFQDLYHSLESCSNKKHAETRRCRYMHRARGLWGCECKCTNPHNPRGAWTEADLATAVRGDRSWGGTGWANTLMNVLQTLQVLSVRLRGASWFF